jgi:hypothetical protein
MRELLLELCPRVISNLKITEDSASGRAASRQLLHQVPPRVHHIRRQNGALVARERDCVLGQHPVLLARVVNQQRRVEARSKPLC